MLDSGANGTDDTTTTNEDPVTVTYRGAAGGVSYTLILPNKTPAVNAPYVLVLSGAVTKTSTGKVSAVSGAAFTLKPASYPDITFGAEITGDAASLMGIIHCTDKTPLAADPDAIQTLTPMDIPEELWGVWEGKGVYIFTPTVWAAATDTTSNRYGFVEGATFTLRNEESEDDENKNDENEYVHAVYTVTGGKITKHNGGTGFDEFIGDDADPGVWYFNEDLTKYAVNDDGGKVHTKRQ